MLFLNEVNKKLNYLLSKPTDYKQLKKKKDKINEHAYIFPIRCVSSVLWTSE